MAQADGLCSCSKIPIGSRVLNFRKYQLLIVHNLPHTCHGNAVSKRHLLMPEISVGLFTLQLMLRRYVQLCPKRLSISLLITSRQSLELYNFYCNSVCITKLHQYTKILPLWRNLSLSAERHKVADILSRLMIIAPKTKVP